jgi:N-acylneuraminate cytidylyltransferase
MNIAIIPARGGSKRIPRKNIRDFCGKPMISYAIGAAKRSRLFGHIIVTTEDEEIAEVSRQSGAETPFVRPADLADDLTPTVPVIAHAIRECERLGWEADMVCCIYPGTPFIQVSDLKRALELLINSDGLFSFPITEFPSAIQRAFKVKEGGKVCPFFPEYEQTRTQDLEQAFHDVGQFYWGSKASWLAGIGIHSNGIGLVIPRLRVVDIDTAEDWALAEQTYEVLNKRWINDEDLYD